MNSNLLDPAGIGIQHFDLEALGAGHQFAAKRKPADLRHEIAADGIDLRRGPAWHAWVVRLGPERHLLNACFSHLVADGWAPRVFV